MQHENAQVIVSLTGDWMLGRTFNVAAPHLLNVGITNSILRVTQNTVWMGNLETTITNDLNAPDLPHKRFHFHLEPRLARELIPWKSPEHVLAFNLANNHMLDYGVHGMEQTLQTLNALGVCHAGAGMDLQNAERACVVVSNGVRVAMLGLSDQDAAWAATSHRPGVVYVDIAGGHWAQALDLVRRTAQRKDVDVLVVYLHWGPNYVPMPPPAFVEFAHALIDSGAAIVAGTSPHHLQQMERYKAGVIFYSLGDFIDDYQVDSLFRSDLGVLAQVQLKVNSIGWHIQRVKWLPTIIEHLQVRLLRPSEPAFGHVQNVLTHGNVRLTHPRFDSYIRRANSRSFS